MFILLNCYEIYNANSVFLGYVKNKFLKITKSKLWL